MRNLTLVLLAASTASLGLRWWDVGRPFLILLAMAAPLLVVASGVVAAVALAFTLPLRAPAAMVVAAGVVAGSLLVAGVAGDVRLGLRPGRCPAPESVVAEAAPAGDRIVVYNHNVLWKDGSPAQVAGQLNSIDPDIAVLVEADDGFARAVIERTEGPWHMEGNGAGATLSLTVLSRWPVSDVTVIESSDRNPVLAVTIEHPRRPLTLAAVHTTAPTSPARVRRWKRELDSLSTLDVDLLVGDFNASAAHRRFRSILNAGYRDTQAEAGCGVGLTWTPFAGPSLLHLDHVLVRAESPIEATAGAAGLVPLALARAGRAGSDHQAVVAVVGIDS